ncbi:hypothetical protein K8R14_01550, partial [bacterium]|nr:hypothetical protein [bacterium]
ISICKHRDSVLVTNDTAAISGHILAQGEMVGNTGVDRPEGYIGTAVEQVEAVVERLRGGH